MINDTHDDQMVSFVSSIVTYGVSMLNMSNISYMKEWLKLDVLVHASLDMMHALVILSHGVCAISWDLNTTSIFLVNDTLFYSRGPLVCATPLNWEMGNV